MRMTSSHAEFHTFMLNYKKLGRTQDVPARLLQWLENGIHISFYKFQLFVAVNECVTNKKTMKQKKNCSAKTAKKLTS